MRWHVFKTNSAINKCDQWQIIHSALRISEFKDGRKILYYIFMKNTSFRFLCDAALSFGSSR